ncbi:MAG TPA: sigma-70 family RNA polymerase sigma factor [Solirubrobacteraceae bacterium]|jgi:RNA polymerase sigma-70 factor (ECF subfamily)|nr:sigma-70 family RNA polymerase sigma factor [Solirubrobacteraceae bacterium]
MTEDPSPDAARDERSLRTLRAARASGDSAAGREALARLLEPYWGWARSIAYAKIRGVPGRQAEADEIAQELVGRLVKALNKKLEFDAPFHIVAAKNLTWAINDYWRRRAREKAHPLDPAEMPEDRDTDGVVEEATSATEQARAFDAYLDGLSQRERELVTERIFLDMTPVQIAARHGMSRAAVDTALHRALAKIRHSGKLDDVRKRYEETA